MKSPIATQYDPRPARYERWSADMGHLGHIKEEYRKLLRRLDAGTVAMPEPTDQRAWHGWKEILEILFTPEEAEVASRLPVIPTSLPELAVRFGMSPEELGPRLDSMCDRGLALDIVHSRTGLKKYVLAPPVVGFFEFSMMRANDHVPKKRMAEALEAYTRYDDAFAREVFSGRTVFGRAMVHETALEDAPPEVLDWERATSLIRDASACAVSLCYCRHKAEHLGSRCKAPMECCLSINGGAEFVVRHGFGRSAEKAEVLDLLAAARSGGLVQLADNVLDSPAWICNCCGCCCGQLQALNHFGLRSVNPSGFQPACDEARCKGCGRCARACPVAAISMAPRRAEARPQCALLPSVDPDRCIGCGVCADACPQRCLRMKRRATCTHVPKNVVELSVRMCLDRGRLADFVFDEAAGRGIRFLNRVLKALTALPPVRRLLASEQLQSRFVRALLARVRGEGGGALEEAHGQLE